MQPRFHGGRGDVEDLGSLFRVQLFDVTQQQDIEEWDMGFRSLCLRLSGDAIEEVDDKGCAISGETFLLLLNAHFEAVPFTLPAHKRGVRWELIFDTSVPVPAKRVKSFKGGEEYPLGDRTCALLRLKASLERRG